MAFIHSGIQVFNRELTNGVKMSNEQVNLMVDDFYSLSPADIQEKHRLNALRSNVIHSGALIVSELLKYINAKEVCFTENDNLEGYYLANL